MAENISVTILTKNSEKHLRECLHALRSFDEILVLDNGSTDNSLQIAKSFPNVKVIEHEFIGFGPLKRLAAREASNDWIFSIDSDEIMTEELADEIRHIELEKDTVYSVKRDNYYHHEKITCCGWANDRVNRLFNRQKTGFDEKLVHESVMTDNGIQIKKLLGTLNHYTFDDASHLIEKMDHYSSLWANDNRGKKKSSPFKAFLRGMFTFFKSYILQKGFLSGGSGLVISVSHANGAFYKYMKLYEANSRNNL